MKHFLLILTLMFHPLFAYKYELSVCAIFQDDARFLKEWIDYHKQVGVQHFYLFNNKSNDNYWEVLKPYIENQQVTLVDWPYDYADGMQWNNVQCQAYSVGVAMARKVSHWLAIIDTDEFIVPVQHSTIPEVLQLFEAASAVGVNWQMYGTSNVLEVPPKDRMTYALTLRGEDFAPEHFVIKSIVQPEKTQLQVTNPHCCAYLTGCCVNTNWQKIDAAIAPYPVVNLLRINHYWTRDEKFMYEVKIPRRNKMYKDGAELILNNNNRYNRVYDDIILHKW